MEVEMTDQKGTPEKTGPPSFMEVCDEIRDEWLSRAKYEADLATKLMEKVTSARSFSETAAAYGDWMSRRIELFADDNRRLLVDAQKVMGAGTRLISDCQFWLVSKADVLDSVDLWMMRAGRYLPAAS